MGVGALIANGSQTLKGSCALFVKQAIVMREERILLKAILLWIHPKLRYLISLKIRKKSSPPVGIKLFSKPIGAFGPK